MVEVLIWSINLVLHSWRAHFLLSVVHIINVAQMCYSGFQIICHFQKSFRLFYSLCKVELDWIDLTNRSQWTVTGHYEKIFCFCWTYVSIILENINILVDVLLNCISKASFCMLKYQSIELRPTEKYNL